MSRFFAIVRASPICSSSLDSLLRRRLSIASSGAHGENRNIKAVAVAVEVKIGKSDKHR